MKQSEVEYYMALPYPALCVQREGRYVMNHPDLPNCEASGATAEDARLALIVAKRSWIETQSQKRLPIPVPRNSTELMAGYRNIFDAFKLDARTFAIIHGVEPPQAETLEALITGIIRVAREQGRQTAKPLTKAEQKKKARARATINSI